MSDLNGRRLTMRGVFLVALLACIHLSVKGQDDCILKLDKDSVRVFICRVNNSKYKAVKSIFLLKSTLSQITAMVMDIENHADWNYKTLRARVLKKISEDKQISVLFMSMIC